MTNWPGWPGRTDRECGEHRPLGDNYSYCYDCAEKCSDDAPCARCELPGLRAEVHRLRTELAVVTAQRDTEAEAERARISNAIETGARRRVIDVTRILELVRSGPTGAHDD